MSSSDDLVISRTLDAPRDLVWKAWTEPERLAQWWGPKGCTIRVAKLDVRPGGMFHYAMQFKPGHDIWGRFVYRETFPQLGDGWPLEILNTLTLTEEGGQTTLTLRGSPINATEEERKAFVGMLASMQQGWGGTLDKLAEHLARG